MATNRKPDQITSDDCRKSFQSLTVKKLIELKARNYSDLYKKIFEDESFNPESAYSVLGFLKTIEKILSPNILFESTVKDARECFLRDFGEDLLNQTLKQLNIRQTELIKKSHNLNSKPIIEGIKILYQQNNNLPPYSIPEKVQQDIDFSSLIEEVVDFFPNDCESITTSTSCDQSTISENSSTSDLDLDLDLDLDKFIEKYADIPTNTPVAKNNLPSNTVRAKYFESLTPRTMIALKSKTFSDFFEKIKIITDLSESPATTFRNFCRNYKSANPLIFFKYSEALAEEYFKLNFNMDLLDKTFFEIRKIQQPKDYKSITIREIMESNPRPKKIAELYSLLKKEFPDNLPEPTAFYAFFLYTIGKAIDNKIIFSESNSVENASNYFKSTFNEDLIDKTLYELSKITPDLVKQSTKISNEKLNEIPGKTNQTFANLFTQKPLAISLAQITNVHFSTSSKRSITSDVDQAPKKQRIEPDPYKKSTR